MAYAPIIRKSFQNCEGVPHEGSLNQLNALSLFNFTLLECLTVDGICRVEVRDFFREKYAFLTMLLKFY